MLARRACAIALLCALPVASVVAAETTAAVPTVKWVLPWKPGTSLVYAMEDTTLETQGGRREHSRTSSTATVRIEQASVDGFVQSWTGTGMRHEVLEGDRSGEALMQQFGKAFEGVALEVELDAAGNYARARNIAELAPRLREAMLAGAKLGIEREAAKQGEAADEALRSKVMDQVRGMVDRMTAPAVLETLLTRNVQWYNGFVGIDIEPDQAYELVTELPSPFGGPAFPATLTFSLAVSADDPDDLFVTFDQSIDPEKGKAAVIAATRTLVGPELPVDALEELAFSLQDEGLFVVHRPTGTVEMFETVRTTRFGDREKVERHRMRLTNGEHAHEWRDEEDGTTGDADAVEGGA